MILVATVAELLEEYIVVVARALEHLLNDAFLPFPRRLRFLILRNLPFASPPSLHRQPVAAQSAPIQLQESSRQEAAAAAAAQQVAAAALHQPPYNQQLFGQQEPRRHPLGS